MNVTAYFLFFFSSLGVFNGLVLATWLLFREKKHPGNAWLAILLLLLCVRIGKSIAFYFMPNLDKSILQLGLSACFLIGPCIVVYIIHQLQMSSSKALAKWAFISLTILVVTIGIVFPYHTYLELWQVWVFKTSSYLWFICLLFGFYLYRKKIKRLTDHWKSLCTDKGFVTLVGGSLICLAYFSASYTSYIMGALSFTLILYLSLVVFINAQSIEPVAVEKYANNKLATKKIEQYSQTLDDLMNNERLFRDPQLTLPRLAKRLSVPHTVLSQLLNDHYQMNFKQYVNSLRITLAKELLIEQPNATIDDISEQCGFSASSTFYNAFKQQTGVTPNRFRTSNL